MATAVACHQAVTVDPGHAEKPLTSSQRAATAVFRRLIRLALPLNQPLPENISHLSIYPHHALPLLLLLLPINLLVSLWGGKLKRARRRVLTNCSRAQGIKRHRNRERERQKEEEKMRVSE